MTHFNDRLLDKVNLGDIDFYEFCTFMQKQDLITEEEIDNITKRYTPNYVKNLQLLNVLRESNCGSSLAKFEQIFIKKSRSSSTSQTKSVFNSTLSAKKMLEKLFYKYGTSGESKPLGLGSQLPRSGTSTVVDNIATSHRATSPSNNPTNEPVVCWHPYTSSHCNSPYASSSGSDTSADSLVIESNLTNAIANEATHLMKVQPATVIRTSGNVYRMTSHPRGLCLIVNNIDFEDVIFPERKGSDEDAKRFDDIFQQLGFEVIMTRNQTADQMRQQFKDVAAACKEEHDALFVFILSHGSEHGIYGTDGIEVDIDSEIITCFDTRNCKTMIGKPKVFVLQACRGRSADFGSGDEGGSGSDALDSIVTSQPKIPSGRSKPLRPSWLGCQLPSSKKKKHAIRTDMLIIFSCLAGFVSVRNELAGSWLGVSLAYYIMTQAHEKNLMEIINLVTSDIIQRESSNGHIQSIEYKGIGMTKSLYFNPGFPRQTMR